MGWKKWTNEEDELLIKLFSTMTLRQMSTQLDRTKDAIAQRVRELRKQGKLGQSPFIAKSKIKDEAKFREMWLNEVPNKVIATTFRVTLLTVSIKAKKLGLPLRGSIVYRSVAIENEKKVFDFLENQGGYCEFGELRNNIPKRTLQRLIKQGKIFKIPCNLSRGEGNYKRFSQDRIFKNGFFRKTFICLDRTAVVRFIHEACQKPKTKSDKRILTGYLKRYLTDAERIAVLWRLGQRKWKHSHVKSSIQVDGVLMPRKKRS